MVMDNPATESVTPDKVLAFTRATEDFLCPLSANEFGIEFVYFKVRDLDSGILLFEIRKEADEVPSEEPVDEVASRTIRYHFGPEFLHLRTIGTTLEFTVGPKPARNFRMIERHYFGDRLLKSFDFTLNFCMPNSKNSWEVIYEVPELPGDLMREMIAAPWETKSDSFYFVEERLIMHNKAEYNYAPFE
mmetsp:Transcript_26642/g.47934  ORF Transcript_26642/g.47934 Transcript_26642/m.47934 type:complete len:189 (+) Transcript_26642:993-1559(+)